MRSRHGGYESTRPVENMPPPPGRPVTDPLDHIEVLGQITDEPGWVIRLPDFTPEDADRLRDTLGPREHPVLVLPPDGDLEARDIHAPLCPHCRDAVKLWTDLNREAQADCDACGWTTFDAEESL